MVILILTSFENQNHQTFSDLNQNHLNEGEFNQNRDFDFENHNFDLKIKIMPNSAYNRGNVTLC